VVEEPRGERADIGEFRSTFGGDLPEEMAGPLLRTTGVNDRPIPKGLEFEPVTLPSRSRDTGHRKFTGLPGILAVSPETGRKIGLPPGVVGEADALQGFSDWPAHCWARPHGMRNASACRFDQPEIVRNRARPQKAEIDCPWPKTWETPATLTELKTRWMPSCLEMVAAHFRDAKPEISNPA